MVGCLLSRASAGVLRNLFASTCSARCRHISTASEGILNLAVIDEKQGIGEICLQSPPLNVLSPPLLSGLVDGVSQLEEDGCQALLVTSALPGVFCAGLDLEQMCGQREDIRHYWHLVQEMFLQLYSSSLITVACITGLARAGGCLLATACDYRVMLDRPAETGTVIGFPETQIGLQVPDWMRMNFCDVVGRRQMVLALQMALLFPGRQALSIGLVDQLADSPEQLRQLALRRVEQFLLVPDVGRIPSKRIATEPLVSYLTARRQQDADAVVASLTREPVQRALVKFLQEGQSMLGKGKNN